MLGFIQFPIADLEPWMLGMMIPITALMIPIIALFQNHQRRMAEIIHGSKNREIVEGELGQLRAELNQLRSTVATQALALEGLASRKPLAGTNDTDSLAQRLG